MPPTPTVAAATAEPVAIFAYGTLRADSGSTSSYTASFNEGCVSVPAFLPCASMYFDSCYPYVVLGSGLASEQCPAGKAVGVRGMLVFPPDLGKKVREADKIEQEGILYKRKVVTVFPEDSEEGVLAYVYVRDSCGPIAIAVDGGDWVAADKVQLNVAALALSEPEKDVELVRRAVEKANGDLRLAKSFLKWGIV